MEFTGRLARFCVRYAVACCDNRCAVLANRLTTKFSADEWSLLFTSFSAPIYGWMLHKVVLWHSLLSWLTPQAQQGL